MKKILITGTAGFIGFHLANRLLSEGNIVIGIDIINDYYDPKVKLKRNEIFIHIYFCIYFDLFRPASGTDKEDNGKQHFSRSR